MDEISCWKGKLETYSDKKKAKIRKTFGQQLTFTIYLELSDMGFSDGAIQEIYEIKRNAFWRWKKDNLKVLKGKGVNC